MSENRPLSPEKDLEQIEEPVFKDRSLLYMGIVLGIVILVMGYLALFVDDPSSLFRRKAEVSLSVEDKSSILNKSESMSDEQVKHTLIKFIEAFYYDQRRGYFDPPSYFADITETFYNYHNLTHKRVKEIYWKRLEDMRNFRRNWIVSTLQYNRIDSRITATYWAKESYFRQSLNENYSAHVKYEMIIDEMGKIVSLREAEVKNVEVQKRVADSIEVAQPVSPVSPAGTTPIDQDKIHDYSLVDASPEFQGGQKELQKYLASNIRYPAAAKQANVQGKVYLSFVVEKDGQLTDVKVKQGIGSGCDEEALRVMRGSPKWRPGLIGESPVRTYYVLPVSFQP